MDVKEFFHQLLLTSYKMLLMVDFDMLLFKSLIRLFFKCYEIMMSYIFYAGKQTEVKNLFPQ